ncbi:hypothetical protein P8C59_001284 [Phyllachora maydis]|uniref:Uncharacterized protein n=1 Tax=Phyllachora maydis TaxID=1825666 RepID=A0AAD9HXV3_9PEZI|nr:hypothetical protein P8C59_001284 [Phyllachora maydis]
MAPWLPRTDYLRNSRDGPQPTLRVAPATTNAVFRTNPTTSSSNESHLTSQNENRVGLVLLPICLLSNAAVVLRSKVASLYLPCFRHYQSRSNIDETHPGVPVTTGSHSSIPLPTPPNSISPALPPHGLKAQLRKAKLALIESDLDLHDGQEEQHAQVQYPCDTTDSAGTATGSPPYDSSGAISPTLLAKFYLPEILLAHGPLAIRHIMGYLTTSVPGFAGIPPAKARRLVVGALEGRGEDEADKMSLDGSASASCSEAPDDDMAMKDNPEDATDDEDWAAVGAAELRARSYQGPPNLSSNVQSAGRGVIRSFSGGMRRAPGLGNLNFKR